MSLHYWLVLHPDITRPIGGAKQMHRLAEAIASTGRMATIIQGDASFHPGWFSSSVNTISYDDWCNLRDSNALPKGSILVLPETYISCASEYSQGIPAVIFNQNASYMFGLPGGKTMPNPYTTLQLFKQPFIKHHLCVSRYDEKFLSKYVFPRNKVSLIVNGLEDSCFLPLTKKKKRIVYMPRKNMRDSILVRALIESSNRLGDWTFVPLDGLSHNDVIHNLRSSLIFLSFGHPEGFGLPVAEALASGCAVVGYSGLGGRELLQIGEKHGVASEVQFGDFSGFISSVQRFSASLDADYLSFCSKLLSASSEIKSIYNTAAMRQSVCDALSRIEGSLSS